MKTNYDLQSVLRSWLSSMHKDGLQLWADIPVYAFLLEHKSLFLSLPRGCGKTTAIVTLSKPGDLIFVPFACAANDIRRAGAPAPATVISAVSQKKMCEITALLSSVSPNDQRTIWFDEVDDEKVVSFVRIFQMLLKNNARNLSIVSLRSPH